MGLLAAQPERVLHLEAVPRRALRVALRHLARLVLRRAARQHRRRRLLHVPVRVRVLAALLAARAGEGREVRPRVDDERLALRRRAHVRVHVVRAVAGEQRRHLRGAQLATALATTKRGVDGVQLEDVVRLRQRRVEVLGPRLVGAQPFAVVDGAGEDVSPRHRQDGDQQQSVDGKHGSPTETNRTTEQRGHCSGGFSRSGIRFSAPQDTRSGLGLVRFLITENTF